MKTPIWDFLQSYSSGGYVRAHMPGHKGRGELGFEKYDITEIKGADSLFSAYGIILESERYAGEIFGADTFYSTEGSSLAIRAMLYLAVKHAHESGKKPKILACRNAPKVFVSAAAMLDFEIEWLMPDSPSYLSCNITPYDVRRALSSMDKLPTALYVTSPDYLGFCLDVREIAEACHDFGVLLLVDNAHGAYLTALGQHPIELGADAAADSAHKTLGALTGGAYLHISKDAPSLFKEEARSALSLFGSTSPSYLILASLDMTNCYLESIKDRLARILPKIETLKERLLSAGYWVADSEPLKITLPALKYGYTGYELSDLLINDGIYCEFADRDYLVLMLSASTTDKELNTIEKALLSIPQRIEISDTPPSLSHPKRKMSVREAVLSPSEILPAKECEGRILSAVTVGCPPAVPILVSGEVVDKPSLDAFEYYGIKTLSVVKEDKT